VAPARAASAGVVVPSRACQRTGFDQDRAIERLDGNQGKVADEIAELKRQLNAAYQQRAEAILAAVSDGHSLRDIAEFLGISHTAVAKPIVGL